MFLRYADNAPMVFWAGLVVDETVDRAGSRSARRLEQFRGSGSVLDISVPWLTTREILALTRTYARAGGRGPRTIALECEAYGLCTAGTRQVPFRSKGCDREGSCGRQDR